MTDEQGRDDPSDGPVGALREALARIEASASFRASRQARTLLRYLVESALAGHADRLKGYTVAVEALGKPADFDSAADPGVRVAMRRLRLLLEDYYAREGAADPHRIALEPGSYVPRLLPGAAPPDPAPALPESAPPESGPPEAEAPPLAAMALPAPARRRGFAAIALSALGAIGMLGALAAVGVLLLAPAGSRHLSFTANGALLVRQTENLHPPKTEPPADLRPLLIVDPLVVDDPAQSTQAAAFAETLRTGLARFSEITVRVGLPEKQDAQYRLRGRMLQDGAVRLELLEVNAGLVLAIFDGATTLGEHGQAVARFIVTSLAQPYGLILGRERARLGNRQEVTGFSCLLLVADYWRNYDVAALPRLDACLHRSIEADPAEPAFLAGLALMRLEAYRLSTPGQEEGRRATLDEAYALVRRAADMAPFDARIRQALGAVHYIRGDMETAISALRRARQLNPFDPDIAADLASRLLGRGQVEEARDLLLEACRYATARPAWMNFFLFLAELLSGNMAGAVERADRLTETGFVLNQVARLIGARLQHDEAAVRRWRRALAERDPLWLNDPAELLRRRFPSAEVVNALSQFMLEEAPGAPVTLVRGRPAAPACLNEPQS
ncbi:tetratricopeptide repeat protein [Rhodovarius crocodyli]|uniref:Tetratricopeptide repeat protein n=1 Tax=Rhodovarius crocodyli TaxID=1979269 RepID=A0A437MD06_9PROT|nr:tetratricopeptide repeat protein [Rhodovarius crocodyli]RVT95544.1 tetratricopeptide repeat protein [Rhodovarius crocodyli]